MVLYSKKVYPELEQSDFDEHISPLLNYICDLDSHSSDFLKNVSIFQNKEAYPYQNPCRLIVMNAWENVWNNELDKYLADPITFREEICNQFSSTVFSYLIRCFSEDIKTIEKKNEDPEGIYSYYTQALMESGFEYFSTKYPIAWGRCNHLLHSKISKVEKIVASIEEHRLELCEQFFIPTTSKILEISLEGDTHNDGASVAVIIFEKGEKVVFKPRSVSGELAYSKLVDAMNTFVTPAMLSLSVIDCGEYGFTSFSETCEENMSMFESGRLACLMYLLNATDMHYSNILWTKEGPLPIDLETLFHPSRVREGISESEKSAYKQLEKSVYGTGILPISISNKDNSRSVDVGFTGIRDKNSASPFKLFQIVDGFSSNIKVIWQSQPAKNELLSDSAMESLIFERCEQIIDGFKSLFNQIYNQKTRFIEMVLEAFENAKFRYIHNMTYRYTQLLRSLTDAEPSKTIDIAHSLLSRMGILSMTSDSRIVESECKQLWNGDIPYFSIDFNGTNIYCGQQVVSYLEKSPVDEFLRKTENLTEKDLDEQLRLIRLAFVAKLADPHSDGKIPDGNEIDHFQATKALSNKKEKGINQKSEVEIIQWFSNSLINSVLDDRYKHLPKTWIGPVARFGSQGWSPGVLGYDLYAGRIGPALSLAVSGKVLSDKVALETATDIFEKSANILDSKVYELRNVLLSGIGAFSGVSGLLWALYAAGSILENNHWKNVSIKSWQLVTPYFHNEKNDFFDMITGPSASIIMRAHTEPEYKISDSLIERSINSAEAKLTLKKDTTTSGLAHGYGQILWFLSSVSQQQKNRKVEKMAKKVISTLEEDYKNKEGIFEVYPDNIKSNISSSWCNGLAGLLIAYYEAYKANLVSRASMTDLIKKCKKIPLSRIPVLCHGSLGIMEALNYVKQSFPNEVSDILDKLSLTYCSSEYIYKYYKYGKGRYPLSPGMMSGRAGALLYLCKLIDPNIKISPLTFEV